MKVAIMQPYFLPYIGYFQLINAADVFMSYDGVQYIQRGWINRNRFLDQGKERFFILPLKKASYQLEIKDRWISEAFNRMQLLKQFEAAYKKKLYFTDAFPIIQEIILNPEMNLAKYVNFSIEKVCAYLDIRTKFVLPTEEIYDQGAHVEGVNRAQRRCIQLCKLLSAKSYFNPMGGGKLYSKEDFSAEGLDLQFLETNHALSKMSILDVMMHHNQSEIQEMLLKYTLN